MPRPRKRQRSELDDQFEELQAHAKSENEVKH